MGFYDLNKEDRTALVKSINASILKDIKSNTKNNLLTYFSDEDTYIRKTAYLAIGRIYLTNPHLLSQMIEMLNLLSLNENEKIRQTVINAVGEIGKYDFKSIQHFMDIGLFDQHHSVRNAVIGSIKKMGEKNPKPVLAFAKKYLHHQNKEIRREICHGIELRGRKFPQDILPLLKELQFDATARVKNTLVHVIGQIAYKKGCLETVVKDLLTWENKQLVKEAIEEIIDVHNRYRNFAVKTQKEAKEYIDRYF